ncbi:MAG: hypothetical protein GVY25_06965 [Bacteroidetes bacterium]|nr:hypothetical protein [Bacteroidota bacterium]
MYDTCIKPAGRALWRRAQRRRRPDASGDLAGTLGPTLLAETPGVAVFFLAGLGALAVALVTVGVKAYRAAMLDPTTALRDE